MNERIRELAEQAGIGYEKRPELDVWIAFDIELEKFAQLIVAECMRLNSKELSITAIERLLPLYQEHFGVAE
jgi:hypothetical protein